MKKILFIISLITLFSCSAPPDFLEYPEVDSPFMNCYSIISIATGSAECPDVLTLKVVKYKDFKSEISNRVIDKLIICVTNGKYVFNDFRLGQTLCDLSVYN